MTPWEIQARADYCRPQVELYVLLVHRLYPKQQVIPIAIFFTRRAEAYLMQLTAGELKNLEREWIERIGVIQPERFEKNPSHYPLCPYFVDEQCLLSDS